MLGLRTEHLTAYRLKVGMDYSGVRHEAGETVTDIPQESILWLLAQGCIELVTDAEGGA